MEPGGFRSMGRHHGPTTWPYLDNCAHCNRSGKKERKTTIVDRLFLAARRTSKRSRGGSLSEADCPLEEGRFSSTLARGFKNKEEKMVGEIHQGASGGYLSVATTLEKVR